MRQASDTPPDGDFARYLEELGRRHPLAIPAADMRHAGLMEQGMAGAISAPEARTDLKPSTGTFHNALGGISLAKHFRWLLALWIGTQVLTRFVPFAGFLMLPVLVADAVWLLVKINQNLNGTLIRRLQALANPSAPKWPVSK
jgi:hypothetical protein